MAVDAYAAGELFAHGVAAMNTRNFIQTRLHLQGRLASKGRLPKEQNYFPFDEKPNWFEQKYLVEEKVALIVCCPPSTSLEEPSTIAPSDQ